MPAKKSAHPTMWACTIILHNMKGSWLQRKRILIIVNLAFIFWLFIV